MTTIKHLKESNKLGTNKLTDLENFLLESGWKCLGIGSFASVWHCEEFPDVVLKIGLDLEDHWLRYADWCRKTKSKYVPKIFDMEVTADGYIAVIERLHKFASWIVEMDIYWPNDVANAIEYYPPYIRRLINLIVKNFAINGESLLDIRDGNVMQRKNGELVITDPIYIE